ncbi:Ger(x)C family spore germination protein [Oceanobacillus bengalensis]|uniref:Ger(X)C family spore germination protein n=1 Tax=Oceanobacillus bengalensis TaxID=1435466 RepID=A0A494YZB0_9BACI|nr:Ger(x)C family spore germination protein [Oceanobacillus bengalensis]RKQ15569.1 Ger(x)C family spore germination protein [Oceanobacillus bengalensis]
MKIVNLPCKLALFSLFFLLLTGCWDQTEVEQLAYVVAIGLDKPEDVKEGLVEITYLIANPQSGAKVGGDEPPREIISFSVNDFINARNLANTVIAKQISYDLLRFIIVSEEFAKDDDFIKWMYDATKATDFRRDLRILVSKESPSTFMQNNEPLVDKRPHKYFDLIFKRGKETGTIPPGELFSFYRITESDANVFLGVYATTEQEEEGARQEDSDQIIAGEFDSSGETNTTQFAGSAVFKEGKMIDTLTIEETRLSFLLSNIFEKPREILTAMPDPFDEDYQLTTRIQRDGNIDMNMDLEKEKPTIDVTVPIVLEVMTNHSMNNYSDDVKKREKLEDSLEDTLTQKFEDLIKKTQEEFGAEPFGWSLIARKEFLSIPEYEEFNWMKTYPEMEINVNVNLRIDKFGRQIRLPDLDEVRD